MNKVRFIAAIAGLVTPVAGMADTTLFGKMNASYAFINDNGQKDQKLRGVGSVLGVKGFTALGGELDATYIIEAGLDYDKSNIVSNTRQAWVGLRGGFGELRAGRQFAATKVSTAPVDLFADQYGDYNAVLESDITFKESLVYINRVGSVGFAVELATDDELSPTTNGLTATDFVINYSKDRVYAAFAMLNAKDNLKLTRLSGAYTFFDGHKVGAAFERARPETGAGHDAAVVSAGYQASPQLMLKAQYGNNKSKAGGKQETLLALGLDYSLGKRTTLSLEHSINHNREHLDGDELKVTAVSLSHRF